MSTASAPPKGRGAVAPSVRVLTLGGVQTRVLESPGAGPTAVLLHGFADSADTWRGVIADLANRGRRTVAIDLPHFGQAGRPADGGVLNRLDTVVAAAARRYDTGAGVVLVGNSLGGLAALRAATDTALPVHAVAALAPAGLITPRWLAGLRRSLPLVRAALAMRPPPVPMPAAVTPYLLTALFARATLTTTMSSEAKRIYASHLRRGDLPRLLRLACHTVEEITAPGVVDPARFEVPVTIAWGTRDWLCPPSGADTVHRVRDDVGMVYITGAGHCLQLDRPHQVAQIVANICCSPSAYTPIESQGTV